MKTFRLPDLGEGLRDAEIVSWHVSVGDRVIADQPLVSVETEKAVVEVPSPWSGRITRLHGKVGDVIEVDAPLAELDGDDISEDTGTVVGELSTKPEEMKIKHAVSTPRGTQSAQNKIKIAPAIRALAFERAVDLTKIKGTGPGGAITRGDVEDASQKSLPQGYEAFRGVRRSMARNMANAHAAIVPATVTDEANITNWSTKQDITLRLIRAIVSACRVEPALNAWFDGKIPARRIHSEIHLGIAMNTEDGLFSPVLRNAEKQTYSELRSELDQMHQDVINRRISRERLKGQTITLSNFGMFGGCHAALVVLPPQVAIVGAGRVRLMPRILSKEIKSCEVLPLSITFDHRAVTGVEATRFLMAMIKDLESEK